MQNLCAKRGLRALRKQQKEESYHQRLGVTYRYENALTERNDYEGTSFGQENVRQVQNHPTHGKVLVICENPRHKQRQG